jgi:hypothetical protein
MRRTKHPRQNELSDISGKSVDHIAWFDVERIPRNKQVQDVVTDDGTIYRWTRHGDSEPWTFEIRVRPDGTTDTTQRTLPGQVDTLVDCTDDMLY